MKNTFFLFLAALFFSASVNAQSTADSIAAKYKLQQMPQPLSVEKAFPVLGTYQLTTNGTGTSQNNITITLDPDNKGIVWIEGLPQGKMKAYLKKSPATYGIVSQKSESGKEIPEGTLIFDPSTNTLNVALGKAFDEADPNSVFNINNTSVNNIAANGIPIKVKTKTATSKSKTKLMFYTATKIESSTSTSTNAAKQ